METETSRTHSNNERSRRPERAEEQKTMEHERKRRREKREIEGKLCRIILPRSVAPKSSIQFANSSKIPQKP